MTEHTGVGDRAVLETVYLRVTDVARALHVWRDLIGLSVLSQDDDTAVLGLAGRPMIALQGGATPPAPDRVLGLFHVAVHVPTRADLAAVLARLVAAGHRHSGQDHLLSEALYFADPDGNGIEIALDTPHRDRIEREGTEGKAFAIDGTQHSMLEPLDLTTLLAELPAGADTSGPLPDQSHIGHIHFRTNARDAVFAFYKDVIGFMPSINSPSFRFCDVGTGCAGCDRVHRAFTGRNSRRGSQTAVGACGSSGHDPRRRRDLPRPRRQPDPPDRLTASLANVVRPDAKGRHGCIPERRNVADRTPLGRADRRG